MEIRNILFDKNIFRSITFKTCIISVGNLTLGGTGKTPLIDYLVRILKEDHKLAILSRGYKRKTRGFRITGDGDNALTVGDEPYQFYRKHKNDLVVAVGEDRILAIPGILSEYPETQCILLDDAYQQRQIIHDILILLCDYFRPFYNDYVVPAGYLRESRKNAVRADVVIVTKCPVKISEDEKLEISKHIRRYIKSDTPVFFSSITYEKPEPVWDKKLIPARKVILVTAIARSEPLVDHTMNNYQLIRHFKFTDHHFFTIPEIEKIVRFYRENADDGEISIFFTEKDIARISKTSLAEILKPYPVFFQPITYNFAGDGPEFERMIKDKIKDSVNAD